MNLTTSKIEEKNALHEHSFKLSGDKDTTPNEEIAIHIGAWEEGNNPQDIPNYEIGKYRGKTIYQIGKILYWIAGKSWTCNTEFHWYFEEVSQKCYETMLKGDIKNV